MHPVLRFITRKTLAALANVLFYLNLDLLVNKHKLIVLMYHGVTDKKIPRGSVENYDGKHVFVRKFEKQLRYLIGRYHIITLRELCNAIDRKKKLQKNSLLITFDDGYLNNYTCAFPILRKYHIPATIFVCSGLVGKKQPNWPDTVEYIIANCKKNKIVINHKNNKFEWSLDNDAQKIKTITSIKQTLFTCTQKERQQLIKQLLKEAKVSPDFLGNYLLADWAHLKILSNAGISIGSHSVNHPILTSEDTPTINKELKQSKITIEQRLGIGVDAFAYPNGMYNQTVINIVKETGYTCAFALNNQKNKTLKKPFELKRIPVTNNYSNTIFFLNLVFNLHKIIYRLRKWVI